MKIDSGIINICISIKSLCSWHFKNSAKNSEMGAKTLFYMHTLHSKCSVSDIYMAAEQLVFLAVSVFRFVWADVHLFNAIVIYIYTFCA